MIARHPHPSGKPIRREETRGPQIWRIPDKGPVIPRLQQERKDISAIGFTAKIAAQDDED